MPRYTQEVQPKDLVEASMGDISGRPSIQVKIGNVGPFEIARLTHSGRIYRPEYACDSPQAIALEEAGFQLVPGSCDGYIQVRTSKSE